MPELPEVETTCRGISPHITGQSIKSVVIRQPKLRWPVPPKLKTIINGATIQSVNRRGKYLLLEVHGDNIAGTISGTMIIHLGMSGSLSVTTADAPYGKHDHIDIIFENDKCLRLRDPRRFGSVLWTQKDPLKHKLLKELGPEPLSDDFDSTHLYIQSRKRKQAIKQFIMNSHNVVGVGNIYANEALFQSGIRPGIAAGKISRVRMEQLVEAIKSILLAAIKQGGTTLRDFTASDGQPGYFQQQLHVYGRDGLPCTQCGSIIKLSRQGQRATCWCPSCQK